MNRRDIEQNSPHKIDSGSIVCKIYKHIYENIDIISATTGTT